MLGFIFLVAFIVVPIANYLKGSDGADNWNEYVGIVRPLILEQDTLLTDLSSTDAESRVDEFVTRAQNIAIQIKAIDPANEDIEKMHGLMEKRFDLIVKGLSQYKDPKRHKMPN